MIGQLYESVTVTVVQTLYLVGGHAWIRALGISSISFGNDKGRSEPVWETRPLVDSECEWKCECEGNSI